MKERELLASRMKSVTVKTSFAIPLELERKLRAVSTKFGTPMSFILSRALELYFQILEREETSP